MEVNKIGIIGAGAWGTALSIMLSRIGCAVDLWVYEKELIEIIKQTGENAFFLPGFKLSDKINPTDSLQRVVRNNSVIFLVAPTHVVRATAERIKNELSPGTLLISASKGIENGTLQTIHEILRETIQVPCEQAAISGPTFAREIAQGHPAALVAAAETQAIAERVQGILAHPKLKVFTSTDIQGVEIGGALKNVIAIATGIADGLNLGFNARAALITRGLVEIIRIGTALGARPETFSGLSGMGDLVLTCTGDLSRNRTVGIALGQGKKLKDIVGNMKMVAEGVRTVKSAYALKNKLNIQASIIEETYRVLYEEKSPQQALEDLMKVEITTEFSGVKGLQ